jgi:uncharacterized protein (DUF1778 family)
VRPLCSCSGGESAFGGLIDRPCSTLSADFEDPRQVLGSRALDGSPGDHAEHHHHHVIAEAEHQDVVLRRRDGADLILGLRSGEESTRIAGGVHCAYAWDMAGKSERLHLRVDAAQKALLEAASQATGTNVSTFVLRVATEAAADVLADRRMFVLDQQAWQVFDDALSGPARDIAGLRELLSAPTVLDAAPNESHQ